MAALDSARISTFLSSRGRCKCRFTTLSEVAIYISKNRLAQAGWPTFPKFKDAVLMLVLKFCEKKIRKRLRDALYTLTIELKDTLFQLKEIEEWQARINAGDQVDVSIIVKEVVVETKRWVQGERLKVLNTWAVKAVNSGSYTFCNVVGRSKSTLRRSWSRRSRKSRRTRRSWRMQKSRSRNKTKLENEIVELIQEG